MRSLEDFLKRIDTSNPEICWISPTSTQVNVFYSGKPTYLIRAIFDYFGKPYNRIAIRTCKNSRCINPNHLLSPTKEEIFWMNVFIGDDNECWEWKSLSGTNQYGNTRFDGKGYSTHRLAYKLFYGNLPDDLYVLHKCDNPPCCNPNHLFLGTHQDNVDDREAKNRNKLPHSKGEDHGLSKLTVDQVRLIRTYYNNGGWSYRRLAQKFGVSFGNIRKIVKRETWNWLK